MAVRVEPRAVATSWPATWTAARMAGCLLVLALALACSAQLVAPFGDSKDGVNAGNWGLASRHVRADGLAASRWGAQADGRVPDVYINHPPLIIATTALSESVLGEHPWSSRLPSLLATCAAALLLLLVIGELGHGPATALAATALAFGTPMVRTYGAMLDTPMLGLPLAVGLTLLWLRSRNGRPAPPVAWALLGLGAGLTSWLGWAVAGGVLVALALGRRRRAAVALGSGMLLAGALVLVWVAQSGAGLHALVDVASTRTEARAAFSLVDGLAANLRSAYPAWTLLAALPGLALAVRRPATRPVVALWWGTVVVWCLAFQERAATHEYWTWWALVPLALGWAAVLDAVAPRLTSGALRRGVPGAAAVLAILGVLLPSPGWTTFEDGQEAGRLLSAATYPPDQRLSWVLVAGSDPLPWVSYRTGLSMAPLRPADVEDLAGRAPDHLVLAGVTAGPPSATSASARCLPAGSIRGRYALVAASDLARALRPGCS